MARDSHSFQPNNPSCAKFFAIFCALALLILALPAQAQTLSILHTFTGDHDGAQPSAGLTIDQAGNFYGTTEYGGAEHGAAGYGTVFKLARSGTGWVLSTLYTFQGGSDGGYPIARVLFGPDGALYGTTNFGGQTGGGTVFSLRPPVTACRSAQCPWTETVLHSFTGFGDGLNPGYGDLAFDAAGNIYGTTFSGGEGGGGTVFKLTRSGESWTESVLYSFSESGNEGYIPYAGVVLDSAGNIYGTTLEGGINNQGVVFQLSHPGSSWMETALHLFGGSNDGDAPFGTLIMDQQGNLYGTTFRGALRVRERFTSSNPPAIAGPTAFWSISPHSPVVVDQPAPSPWMLRAICTAQPTATVS